MHPIHFGTDGWRAVIAEEFTFDAVRRIAQAAALHWRQNPPPGKSRTVVVGYDTRFLSDRFAVAAAEVFAGNGFRVILGATPAPTPALSYAVRSACAAGGVMITASHNPPIFNGFKLKSHLGGAADSETLTHVEQCLDVREPRVKAYAAAIRSGAIAPKELRRKHANAVKQLVDLDCIARSGLRIAHDALFGVGAGCFKELLKGTSCEVTGINTQRDPLFGGLNPEPIATNYDRASQFLKRHPHDVCLVTDGDADRIGALDGTGHPLTTHQVICLILSHLILNRRQRGRVVKALTTTSLVDKICAAHSLALTTTGVGFKYICAEMIKGDVLAGVEESGGVAVQGHIPERDGLAAGMLLLELLAHRRLGINALLKELEVEFGPHHYGRIDLHLPKRTIRSALARLRRNPPERLSRSPVEQVVTLDGLKFVARDDSWLMLRGSGTEPVVRVYAEAGSPGGVRRLLSQGKRLLAVC